MRALVKPTRKALAEDAVCSLYSRWLVWSWGVLVVVVVRWCAGVLVVVGGGGWWWLVVVVVVVRGEYDERIR